MPKSRGRKKPAPRRPAPQRRTRSVPVVPAPTATGLRGEVERRSGPVLVWLSTRPKVLLPLVSLALLIGGLAAPVPLAVPMLLVLLVLVAWLTYLSWPAVHGTARLLRVATLGLVALAGALRLLGG